MNKKGFTLIELLAVIVILAVLMAIAIPKVTQYITKSRKDSLVTTSKDFINAVRNDATSEMFDFPIGVDDVTIISLDLIKLEKGGKKSSFNGAWLPKYSYVAVINVGTDEDPDATSPIKIIPHSILKVWREALNKEANHYSSV